MIHGIHYATGQPVSLTVKDGRIVSIEASDTSADVLGDGQLPTDTKEWPIIAPGLVDLQINGYGGRDFNALPLPESLIGDAIRSLWKEGVTSSYPTVITNNAEAIEKLMAAIASACEQDEIVAQSVAGIHLEGPFISPEDGVRGAHAREHVTAPDWELFCRWQRASGDRIQIITLSPEWPGSADFIRKCTNSGVRVSIGHTAATPEQIEEAVSAGACMSTHLGNGAHLMLPRHPNYIWEQLAQDELYSCIIADGFHLPKQVLKVIMKVKGDKAILVSDAVSLSGMEPGAYSAPIGGEVVLTPAGKLHLAGNEKILAGSAQMLMAGIEHLIKSELADLPQAWEMSSLRPAKLMNLPVSAGLSVGAPADIVLLRQTEGRLLLEQTYKAGECVFRAN